MAGDDLRSRWGDAIVDLSGHLIPCSQFILARESSVLRDVMEATEPAVDDQGRRVLAVPQADRGAVGAALDAMHMPAGPISMDVERVHQAIRGTALLGADATRERLIKHLVDTCPFAAFSTFLPDAIELDSCRNRALDKLMMARPLWTVVRDVILRTRFRKDCIIPLAEHLAGLYPASCVAKLALQKLPPSSDNDDLLRVFQSTSLVETAHPGEIKAIAKEAAQMLTPSSAASAILQNVALAFRAFKINADDLYATSIEFEGEPSASVHLTSSRGLLPVRFTHRHVPWMCIETDFSTGFMHIAFTLTKLDKALVSVRHVEMRVMLLDDCDVVLESWFGFTNVDGDQRLHTYEASWAHNLMVPIHKTQRVTALHVDVFYSNSKSRFQHSQFL